MPFNGRLYDPNWTDQVYANGDPGTSDGVSHGASPGDPSGFHTDLPTPAEFREMIREDQDQTYDQMKEWFDEWTDSLSDNSGKAVTSSGLKPETIDYLNAELAKHYGMSRESAYQEALSNTAYQRAVADMQAAGLNPAAIFGNGKGATAGGVGYVSSSSNGSVGSAKQNDKLFSSGLYNGIANLVGIAGAIATKKPSSYFLFQNAAKGIMNIADGIF